MNKSKLGKVMYAGYGLLVVAPLILSFIPLSWGVVANVADAILSFAPLGILTTLMLIVAPFIFFWLFRVEKKSHYRAAAIASGVLFILFVVSILMLARGLQEF